MTQPLICVIEDYPDSRVLITAVLTKAGMEAVSYTHLLAPDLSGNYTGRPEPARTVMVGSATARQRITVQQPPRCFAS